MKPNHVVEQNNTQQFSNKPPVSCKNKYSHHPTEREHRTAEQHNWRWQNRIGGLTLVAAIAAAAAAVVAAVFTYNALQQTIRQADEAVKQTGIAQEQLTQGKASSRPYVIAQISTNAITRSELSENSNIPAKTARYTATLHFTNFGSTPAIIKKIEGTVAFKLPPDRPQIIEEHGTDLVLSQGSSTSNYLWYLDVSSAEEQNLVVGSGTIYVQGEVVYTDTLGVTMKTPFCYLQPTHSHVLRRGLVPIAALGCANQF